MNKLTKTSLILKACLSWVLISVASTCFATEAEPVDTTDQELVSVLARTTILVRDVEVSKRFYTYALGYEVLMDRDITRPIIIEQMGLEPQQTVRFAILKSSHVIEGKKREGAGIGLIQVSNPAPPVMSRPDGATLASGEMMMAVRTTDIDTVYQRLQELDAKILLHPMRAHEGTAWELVVHDPDGIRIHVVQRPDGPYD